MKMARVFWAVVSICLFSSVLCSTAALINITKPDTVVGGTGWKAKTTEDNEVEPGCDPYQKWDLEAFIWDTETKKLYMVGGYNFQSGVEGFNPGDLFIDINGDARYGVNAPKDTTGGGYDTVLGDKFKYEYVLDMTPPPGAAPVVYDVSGTAREKYYEVFYDSNYESNPWRWKSGGVAGTDPVTIAYSYFTGAVSLLFPDFSFLGETGNNKHYVTTITGLGAYVGDDAFFCHYTYGCGNDMMVGKYEETPPAPPVPDTGMTLVLLGSGLCAIGLIGRRLRN